MPKIFLHLVGPFAKPGMSQYDGSNTAVAGVVKQPFPFYKQKLWYYQHIIKKNCLKKFFFLQLLIKTHWIYKVHARSRLHSCVVYPSLAKGCQNHCLEAGQMKHVLREPVGEDWLGTRGEQLLDLHPFSLATPAARLQQQGSTLL